MSHVSSSSPAVVEGDIIRPSRALAWLCFAFSIFPGLLALGVLSGPVLWLLSIVNLAAPTPKPADSSGVLLGCGALALAGILFGRGWWLLTARPHWVIGKDQLQFVGRGSRVRLAIPYSNLAAAELCRPGEGNTPFTGVVDALMLPKKPFIGLRLLYPDLIKSYAGGSPLDSNRVHERFGYHWRIMDEECAVSLKIVLKKIMDRWEQWRVAASNSSAVRPVPEAAKDAIPSPPPQENFTPKNR